MKEEYPLDHQCPQCGHQFDLCSPMISGGRGPRPGDCLLCIGCGSSLRLNPAGRIEVLTEADMDNLPLAIRAQLLAAKSALKAVKARRN